MSAAPSSAAPRFPQLAVAKDPERMLGILQQHLRPLAGRAYRIRGCRVSFSRDRSAQRCLLQYTLDLVEPETGREWSQLVTGVIYAGGRTARTWKRLERVEQRREQAEGTAEPAEPPTATSCPVPALAPVVYVPDLDMLLQVFPYDHRLPGLARLLAGPPPALVPLLLARFGPGDWRAERWDAEAVRYRVDLRATLLVGLRGREAGSGRTEERRFYAKVYREEQGKEADRLLRELADKAGTGFAVVPPVAYVAGLQTLVQEEAPGRSLLGILGGRDDEAAVAAMRRAAAALAALHRLDVAAPQRRPLQGELASLERVGGRLRSTWPHLRPAIDEVVGAVVTGLEEVPPAPIHGDFKPNHILLDGDRVTLLDLDRIAAADPMIDVANLLGRVAKTWPRFGRSDDHRRAVARAFVEEYFAHAPTAGRARLPLHYAMALFMEVDGPLQGERDRTRKRQHRVGGSDQVEALVREAQSSVAGTIW